MKKYNLIFKIFAFALILTAVSCVHDDDYDAPNLNGYKCADLTPTMTLAQAKALLTGSSTSYEFTNDDIIEGYVSSSDESGNIYKYLYIQDAPSNPTQGMVISLDAINNYLNFPKGSKVYIKLKGLMLGKYGGITQLGGSVSSTNAIQRIDEKAVPEHIFKSCSEPIATIVPKVMTLGQLGTANDQYIGCLVEIDNAQFASKHLCSTYAPDGQTVDKQIMDPTSSATTRVVRNSGYASFANQILPSGNGKFVGILSKYSSTYQFYINSNADLDMNGTRTDGIVASCSFSTANASPKTVAEVKSLLSGNLTQITGDFYLKARITANDKTGNLYKYYYVEDATGGLRINADMVDMYLDPRFEVGNEALINLKGMYLGNVSGEIQLGGLNGSVVGWTVAADIPTHLFKSDAQKTNITATELTIPTLTTADVGKWIKISNLQFADTEIGNTYNGNRTLQDCAGNTVVLRTSSYADFATSLVAFGKGDLYGILSIYNGTYQIWVPNYTDLHFNGPRCDGTLPSLLLNETFDDFTTNSWIVKNVLGTQAWSINTTYGNPKPSAYINGNVGSTNYQNEDWLISKPIDLTGYTNYTFSFDTWRSNYPGNLLQVYVTSNYTGDPATTTWTQYSPALHTGVGSSFVNSGPQSLDIFAGQTIRIAFKYTSTNAASNSWEVDNIKVLAK